MRFKKQPKQKNVKQRQRDWLTNPQPGQFKRPIKTGFKPYLRKNPGQ